MKKILGLLFAAFTITNANAGDLDDLAKQGYAVLAETKVDGTFEGCDYDRIINLKNGLLFECKQYGYSYGYRPDVYILKNVKNGDIKVIIKDREYRGKLWKK